MSVHEEMRDIQFLRFWQVLNREERRLWVDKLTARQKKLSKLVTRAGSNQDVEPKYQLLLNAAGL